MNPQQPAPAGPDATARPQPIPPARPDQPGLQVPPRPRATPTAPVPMTPDIRPAAPAPQPPTPTIATVTPAPPVAAAPAQAVSFSPTPTPPTPAAPPPSEVSFQPDASHSGTNPIAERIDETPQQNSKDIEELISHQHRLKRLKGFASTLIFIAAVVVAAFLINTFVFQSYYVDGTSMTPTLQNDDRLIIDKVERTWAHLQGRSYIPERGQIIVLDSSIVGIGGREEQLIKRVIGIPGDTVIVQDGTVTIKNKEHPEGFDVNKQLGIDLHPTFASSPIEVTIADDQVYVMGDNRAENGSYDSRAFGPIESNKIVGRLWARILPLDKASMFN